MAKGRPKGKAKAKATQKTQVTPPATASSHAPVRQATPVTSYVLDPEYAARAAASLPHWKSPTPKSATPSPLPSAADLMKPWPYIPPGDNKAPHSPGLMPLFLHPMAARETGSVQPRSPYVQTSSAAHALIESKAWYGNRMRWLKAKEQAYLKSKAEYAKRGKRKPGPVLYRLSKKGNVHDSIEKRMAHFKRQVERRNKIYLELEREAEHDYNKKELEQLTEDYHKGLKALDNVEKEYAERLAQHVEEGLGKKDYIAKIKDRCKMRRSEQRTASRTPPGSAPFTPGAASLGSAPGTQTPTGGFMPVTPTVPLTHMPPTPIVMPPVMPPVMPMGPNGGYVPMLPEFGGGRKMTAKNVERIRARLGYGAPAATATAKAKAKAKAKGRVPVQRGQLKASARSGAAASSSSSAAAAPSQADLQRMKREQASQQRAARAAARADRSNPSASSTAVSSTAEAPAAATPSGEPLPATPPPVGTPRPNVIEFVGAPVGKGAKVPSGLWPWPSSVMTRSRGRKNSLMLL